MLEIDNASYAVNQRNILNQITVSLAAGKLHGILGPNGSGKSTLLKLISGIWRLSQGKISFNGQNLSHLNRLDLSRLIAYVPQTSSFTFELNVLDFVQMGGYAAHVNSDRTSLPSKSLNALKFVNADHLLYRQMQTLSGGEKQRIFIARGLMSDCPILLLDEPTVNLDIGQELQIWQLLAKLKNAGKLVIVTLHDLHKAENFCDELLLLREGKCVAQGEIAKVPLQKYIYDTYAVMERTDLHTRSYGLLNDIALSKF